MLARGALGNPWLFARLLGEREAEPTREEVLAELDWVMDRAVEHLGPERAGPLPAQVLPLVRRADGRRARSCTHALQQTSTVEEARAVLAASESLQPA